MKFELSKKAFKHTLKLKMQYFNGTNFAEIINNINMDVASIGMLTERSTFYIVSSIFRIFGGIIGLLIIDRRLALLVLMIIPIRYWIVSFLAKAGKRMQGELIKYNSEFSSWYGDNIQGIKEIKLWGLETLKTGEFIKKQKNIVKGNIKLIIFDKVNELSESLFYQIIISILYIIGACMIFQNSFTLGGLTAFITYSAYVTAPISAILNIGYGFSRVIPSAKRLFNFLNMECEDCGQAGIAASDKSKISGSIKFENVSFCYNPGEYILKNVSFKIDAGEKVAIIGLNGSGKSTVINLILRFIVPTEGRILIGDTDISNIRLKDYRQLLSVVCQDVYLFNTSIKNNIDLKRQKNSIYKCEEAAKKCGAHEFIRNTPDGYNSIVGRNGANLSGGQRQKIALARTLIEDSKIVILDEATSNCDAESENYLSNSLEELYSDKTVIIITHKTEILKKMDRILLIDKGVLADLGTHEELIGRSILYRVFLSNTEKGKIA